MTYVLPCSLHHVIAPPWHFVVAPHHFGHVLRLRRPLYPLALYPSQPFYYKLFKPNYPANNVSLKLVRMDVEKAFSASSIRWALGDAPCVYNCDAWCKESMVRFRVSIFQAAPQKQTGAGSLTPNHIVEFNQLSGCPWAFAQVMRDVNQNSKYGPGCIPHSSSYPPPPRASS